MADVDSLQNSEEAVAQQRQEAAEKAREAALEQLRKAPLADTALKTQRRVEAKLDQVRNSTNMREGPLPEVEELAISLLETGLLHPPLVRETGDEAIPYELVAGFRRVAAMRLVDEAEGEPRTWAFDLRVGMSRREALTLQFAENFHQRKPEPIMFARAVRQIMIEDPALTAAEVSRLTGAPADWTRGALKLLDLPAIADRVEAGDLAFTAADMVRRAISTGRVDEREGVELAQKAADGEITTGELRRAVGYVPPKPEGYDELASELDRARWEARQNGAADRAADADQRDWESGGHVQDPGYGANASGAGPVDPAAGGARPDTSGGQSAEEAERRASELDAYLLGRVLNDLADDYRELLGIVDDGESFQYAFALRPYERVAALRMLARKLLESDPNPPAELSHLARA
ncbi:ParB N-terminal domain-containing protein [Conexibacter sp. JD483]|uniref:ParB/RepB/Spo0J family partition protein n=1 Tax=unclassified Conexibacter TaxID=2627773 RepID=UPI00271C42E1|nr:MULTISPECIES: ParB N-terminal domain-containing protein [unclassified Conexibacter]MDO8185522.1 ParB N-terminal domain-containing protein [Conexibacter sp. CPCC 205706]MDO8197291.1 ParB N-terminal domain-containing protein [Conexibacter sp. CPCC 205762]MDR9370787.1 ParB N-terminal domain-containing protein [Conexibacter sp. JD483]